MRLTSQGLFRTSLAGLVFAGAFVSVGVFVACSDDTGTTPGTTTSSSSGALGDGGNDVSDADNGEGERDADDGIKYAPNGCPLVTTKYITGKKVENLVDRKSVV